ncbi:MAG: thrombospondin type 3 repeat-containing protein, partial [Thaumarchaeota archaeon]|nr:thrombospondin type 3 repeat-containing protein [Nitrososphaerota archaeon]
SIVSTYLFADVDGDGIDDRWDACLDEQENFNGYLDWDGCPDVLAAESTSPIKLDSDGDGYPDVIDSCPTSPETWNKYNDHDGCPDTAPEQQRFVHDDDLDGIINDKDLCPLEPEDYKGVIDGCPDN